MSIAFAEKVASVSTETKAADPSGDKTIPIIIFVLFWAGLIFLIIRIKKKRKKRKQEKYDKVETQIQESAEIQKNIEEEMKSNGFVISSATHCEDKLVHRPKEGNILGEYVSFSTKAFYIDKQNRRVAFAWIQTPPAIKYIDFDDIISCEIIYKGIKETTRTYIGNKVGNTHVGSVVSGGSEYVNQLGIKLMVRDPSNPTFIMPLITSKTFTVDPSYKECAAFAQKVRDSINVIINM